MVLGNSAGRTLAILLDATGLTQKLTDIPEPRISLKGTNLPHIVLKCGPVPPPMTADVTLPQGPISLGPKNEAAEFDDPDEHSGQADDDSR